MSPSNYSPTDPDYNVPLVRYEPKSIEEDERMRNGREPTTRTSAGDRNIEAHHRKQKSTANGGIIDDLEGYTQRRDIIYEKKRNRNYIKYVSRERSV